MSLREDLQWILEYSSRKETKNKVIANEVKQSRAWLWDFVCSFEQRFDLSLEEIATPPPGARNESFALSSLRTK